MSEEISNRWKDLRKAAKEVFKESPVGVPIFLLIALFYVFGYFYNNIQNSNRLFSTAWFYDSIILSWTNLLILPLLLFVFPWQRDGRDWSVIKQISKIHLFSPALWIFGYLGIRLIYKLLLDLNVIIESVLNWLAS
jgi:hypothetical protein